MRRERIWEKPKPLMIMEENWLVIVSSMGVGTYSREEGRITLVIPPLQRFTEKVYKTKNQV